MAKAMGLIFLLLDIASAQEVPNMKWNTHMRALVNCMYSSMAKGTSQAEAMLNSKPVALAIVELHKSEGISQVVSYLVSQ